MKSRTFEGVELWRKAHAWVLAVSVPANFAEGFKKRGLADKVRFYNIAQGSLEECRYYLILARDLGYGDSRVLSTSLEEVSKMCNPPLFRTTHK